MKLALLVNSWDDPQGLLRLFESSVYDFASLVIVIEGQYEGRESGRHDPKLIQEICRKYDKVHYVEYRLTKQINKRNRYWDIVEESDCDYALVIDTDEYADVEPSILLAELERLKDKPYQCFPVFGLNMVTEQTSPRLFKRPFNFRHRQNKTTISHGSLYNPEGKEIIQDQYEYWKEHEKRTGVKGIYLYHDKTLREKERVDSDYVWYMNNPTR